MGPEQEGLIEIILWSNPDQVMVEEDHFMVELTLPEKTGCANRAGVETP
jgi:hypothetical protein